MANKEKPNDSAKRLKQDRLVDQLRPDPGSLTPTIQLTGWLGKGTKEGSWFLYFTPQLDDFVAFSEEDVVHTEPVPQDQSQLGPTMVWLRAGTVLQHTQVQTRQVQADFLSGGITSGFMAGTASSYPATAFGLYKKPVTGPGCTRNYVCSTNPHIPVCQVHTERGCGGSGDYGCGSGAFCESGAFVCGNTVGCSVGKECSVGCY